MLYVLGKSSPSRSSDKFYVVITDKERKAFMNNFSDMIKSDVLASQTNNDIDEEGQKKFFVEKVLKCKLAKRERKNFLSNGLGTL